MSSPIQIPLTESQKNLLQRDEFIQYVEPITRDKISTISFMEDSYVLHLGVRELFCLIDAINFVSFHEINNQQRVVQLEDLSGYLEPYLSDE